MTSKQRAKLRALANRMETILQVGKSGITPALEVQCRDALTARELMKGRVLETSPLGPKEAAVQLAEAVNAQVVQVMGSRFVLYKPNPEKPGSLLD